MATEEIWALRTTTAWNAANGSGEMDALYPNGYYTTIFTWELNQNYDITTATGDDTKQILEAYPDEDWKISYPTVDFAGGKQDKANDNILLIRAASSERFDFPNLTGVEIGSDTGASYGIVARADHVLIIESCGYSSLATYYAYSSHEYIEFNGCYIHDLVGIIPLSNNGKTKIVNSLIECPSGSDALHDSRVLNSVIIAPTGHGSASGQIVIRTSYCENVIIYNEDDKVSYDTFYQCTGDYNAQNNNGSASPPGTNSISTVTDTGTFEDYAGGDYHLASNSTVCNGTGNNLIVSSELDSPRYDIDEDAYPSTGDWDIGFDYYVSAVGPIAVNDSYSVTDGTTLVVNVADGILDNDTYNCT